MKPFRSITNKIKSYPKLLVLCWILIPLLTVDTFYTGKWVPIRIRKTFVGLEKQWHDFLIRQQSNELIDRKRKLDQDIKKNVYQKNSQTFQKAFDSLVVRTRTHKDIAIVAVDEKTLTKLGEWPVRRHHYAHLLDRILIDGKARGVVFDIMFSEQGDRLPIQKLTQLKDRVVPSLKPVIDQAIQEIDYDRFLEATMNKHRYRIVAGYTTLQEEESKVKDYSKVYFPEVLRKYPTEHLNTTILKTIPEVKGGVYNYPGILDNILYRGFFSVPTDELDGLVRDVDLLTQYPMKFRHSGGELSEETKELFGSLDLETYAMLTGTFNPPEEAGPYLVLKGHARKLLNKPTREKIKSMVREAISRVSDLSTFQRDLLERIIEKSDLMKEDVYRGLTLFSIQYTLGLLNWSENPDEGFLLNLVVKEPELKEEILADLSDDTRRKILRVRKGEEFKAYLEPLKSAHRNLESNLIRLLLKQILAPLEQEMVLLHSFPEEECQRVLRLIRDNLGLGKQFLTDVFKVENLDEVYPEIKMSRKGRVGINYYGLANSYPVYSFTDVISEPRLSPKYLGYELPAISLREALENRVVYIGPTAVGISDWRNTPIYKQLDGVELHAHALGNLRTAKQILRGPDNRVLEGLFIVALGIILPLILISLNAVLGAVVVLAIVVGYFFFCSSTFMNSQNYFYFIPPFLQSLGTYILQTSYSYIKEQKERRKTRNAFQHYVNASVVDAVLRDPDMLKLGGQRRELSVLFSDVRGFTTISEGLAPETLVALMNEYLTEMTDLVPKYNGTLDKFIGDAVMAFWGAPIGQEDHVYRAVMTAIEMNQRVAQMHADFMQNYGVEVKIGIGVNTGPAVVGNMGSKSRFDYTILGDTVNLGARLEGQTKNYGVELIVSESTHSHIKDWAATRFLDLIAVKGKTEPVRIYECPGVKKEMDSKILEGMAKFEEAVDIHYFGRNFAEGIPVFEKLKEYWGGENLACDLYIERLSDFVENPPEEAWNGVFVATSK